MTKIDRRTVLRGLGASVLSSPFWSRQSAAGVAPPARRPRHWVFVFLAGGIDAVYTTDPKTRKDVDSFVDVPYSPGKIIRSGDMAVGPVFEPLRPVLDRLAIVNGIRMNTANHNSGWTQFWRMNTGTLDDVPTLSTILGELRNEEQPIGVIPDSWLHGRVDNILTSPSASTELAAMQEALRFHANQHGNQTLSRAAKDVATGYSDAARSFERIAAAPSLEIEEWFNDRNMQKQAVVFQRALWFLENDLPACMTININASRLPFDSHRRNAAIQTSRGKTHFSVIARFLQELAARKSKHGNLSELTNVVMGSELGRFPGLNALEGKDHFPEAPLIVSGPSFDSHDGRGAQYGMTGRQMESLPINIATGRAQAAGHRLVLDDVGTTIVKLAGVNNPSTYGYTGRVLDFLLR